MRYRGAMRTMMRVLLPLLLLVSLSASAQAALRRVPAQYATIQAAVDAADDGDVIRVGAGEHCGATITREVHLVGSWNTSIVGCATPAPALGLLRVGFFLPDERASGTTIHFFRFDGAGVSDDNLEPLAFGVFARDAHGVSVIGTRTTGTVQAISNTDGDGWFIAGNHIRDLTLFECPGFCGGGSAIVIHKTIDDGQPAWGNSVIGNRVSGAIPDGHELFDMTGVFVRGQERPVVAANVLGMRDNPAALARGIGVLVSSTCCGLPEPILPTTRAVIVGNDGRASELAVVVEDGNAEGAVIAGNRGVNVIEGDTFVVP